MTYRGRVKNGVVVLEGSPPLEEGTRVRVETDNAPSPQPGTWAAIRAALDSGAVWEGDAAEMDRLLADLKEMKRDDVRREQARDAEQS